jgi:periplasmic protein TonB
VLSRWRSGLGWLLLLSLLLHISALLGLWLAPAPPPLHEAIAPPSVDVVMEPPGAANAPPEARPESHPTTPESGPENLVPSPTEPPPEAPPLPPLPPPSPAAPPIAAPAPSSPPADMPAPPSPPAATAPLPPPPAPSIHRDEPIVPPVARRPAAPRPPPFPAPIARSFASIMPAPVARPSPPITQRRGIDLALGPASLASKGAVPHNPATNGTIRIEGADLGPDWVELLQEWWNRHSYYPREAAARGEDGTTQVRLHVDRSGQVKEVELVSRSGSQWLDMGSLAIFRGAKLPPFPPSTPQNQADLVLTLNFYLIRR